MTEQDSDETESEIEPFDGSYIMNKDMVDSDTLWESSYSGFTKIRADIDGGVGDGSCVHISRPSSTGDHRHLSADEAKQMADEIRELAERDSALLRYFTAGGEDDPEDLADALEAGSKAVSTVEGIDDEFRSRLNLTMHKIRQEDD